MSAPGRRVTASTYQQVQADPDFVALRSRLRRFVFPVSALFLSWYLAYVLLAALAPGFMALPVAGNINVGLVVGLLQFVSTFAITTWYVTYADRFLDPTAEVLRRRIEGEEPR